MKNHVLIVISSIWFGGTSCSLEMADNANSSTGSTDSTAVETNPANATYRPAFSGQTRIAGVSTTTPYASSVVAETLRSPWGITSLPDGRLLITEKAGMMRIATPAGQLSAPITGIPVVNAAGQGGLLGVRVDPAFSTNRMIYWVFSESQTDGNV